jgi:hypothetical protein
MSLHKVYIRKYPDNSKTHGNKVEDWKHNLRSLQALCYESNLVKKARAATIASYKITEVSSKKKKKKNKKPFEDGTVIEEL